MQSSTLTRAEVIDTLRSHREVLSDRFGVEYLAIFGSFARDEATDESDLDVLVKFEGRSTFKGYFGTQFYIEDLLGLQVDLVTDKALRKEFRPYVEKDLIRV